MCEKPDNLRPIAVEEDTSGTVCGCLCASCKLLIPKISDTISTASGLSSAL